MLPFLVLKENDTAANAVWDIHLIVLCYVADFACHDIRRRIPSLPRTHDAPDRGSMDFDPDSGYLTKHYKKACLFLVGPEAPGIWAS